MNYETHQQVRHHHANSAGVLIGGGVYALLGAGAAMLSIGTLLLLLGLLIDRGSNT